MPRYSVTYSIAGRSYWFTIPAPNAAHIWRGWDRPGSTLTRVEEVNENNLPYYP
jgi:hypothetical protein